MYSFCGKKFRTTLADTICCRNRRGLKTRSFTLTTRTGQSSRNQWNSHTIHSGTKKLITKSNSKIHHHNSSNRMLAFSSQQSRFKSIKTLIKHVISSLFSLSIHSFIYFHRNLHVFTIYFHIFQNWNSVFDNFRKPIIRLRTFLGG